MPQKESIILNQFMLDLETSAVPRALLSKVSRTAKNSKEEYIRAEAKACLALYNAYTKSDYTQSLNSLSEYLYSGKHNKKKNSKKKKRQKNRKNKILSFPPPDQWSLKYPIVSIYAGKILLEAGKIEDALTVFDIVGSKIKGVPRVLAAEAVADANFSLAKYSEAVEYYRTAKQFFKKELKRMSGFSEYKKSLKLLRKRIDQKLDKAISALDTELYGPEFVIYRQARKAQMNGDELNAVYLYSTLIKNYPDNTFAEAATLYKAQCLIRISEKTSEIYTLRKKIIHDYSDENIKKILKKYKKNLSNKLTKYYTETIRKNETKIAAVKNIPLSGKAAELAVDQLTAFIEKNKFGLYRGEAYITLAEFFLKTKFNPTHASDYLVKAENWFSFTDKLNSSLNSLKIPFKAQTISTPPSLVYEQDQFGNIDFAKIKPDCLINRNSCPWYMNLLKTRLYALKGFISFYNAKPQEALSSFSLMRNFDELGFQFRKNGDFDDYARLSAAVTQGFFYAFPQELEKFKGKAKLAVLLGDFYYITRQYNKAENLYRRILIEKPFPLNKTLKSYALYMLGSAEFWKNKRINAITLWKKSAAAAPNSFTARRSLFAVGQIGISYLEKTGKMKKKAISSIRRNAVSTLKKLADSKNKDIWQKQAAIVLAVYYAKHNSKHSAIKLLASVEPENKYQQQTLDAYRQLINDIK